MAQRIVPMIAYEDAAAAIDWLREAFGFTERVAHRYTDLRRLTDVDRVVMVCLSRHPFHELRQRPEP